MRHASVPLPFASPTYARPNLRCFSVRRALSPACGDTSVLLALFINHPTPKVSSPWLGELAFISSAIPPKADPLVPPHVMVVLVKPELRKTYSPPVAGAL